jgi:hypothetical protein
MMRFLVASRMPAASTGSRPKVLERLLARLVWGQIAVA